MKTVKKYFNIKAIAALVAFCLLQVAAFAQDSTAVDINAEGVQNWFSENWMWVAIGAVVLIVLIAMMSGGSRKTEVKKTTIVKEEDVDGVVRTTTTEIRE